MGLDVTIVTQSPNFGSSFVQDAVLQNCQRHEWFFCGNAAVAQLGASDLGDSKLKEELMTLPRGVRYVKQHRNMWREYVTPLEANPWYFPGLEKRKAFKALRQIQQRPEYQSPSEEFTAPMERLDRDELSNQAQLPNPAQSPGQEPLARQEELPAREKLSALSSVMVG